MEITTLFLDKKILLFNFKYCNSSFFSDRYLSLLSFTCNNCIAIMQFDDLHCFLFLYENFLLLKRRDMNSTSFVFFDFSEVPFCSGNLWYFVNSFKVPECSLFQIPIKKADYFYPYER